MSMPAAPSPADLLPAIYRAASDAERWPDALRLLASSVGGIAPALNLTGQNRDAPSLWVALDHDPTSLERYEQHYLHVDPRRPGIQRLGEGCVFTGQQLISDRELTKTEFYADFLRPQGFFHIAGGIPLKKADRMAVLRVLRPPGRPGFGRRELRLIGGVLPHVRQALEINWQIARVRRESDAVRQALDRLPTAVFVLDDQRRILEQNARARGLLRASDGLVWRARRLDAVDADASKRLASIFTTGCAGNRSGPCGRLNVPRGAGRRPLHLAVLPIADAPPDVPASSRASAVVFVSDPEDHVRSTIDTVAQALGLTKAEARIAIALAEGRTTREAAALFGISVATAETQRKSCLAKAGVRRQADLVRLVLALPPEVDVGASSGQDADVDRTARQHRAPSLTRAEPRERPRRRAGAN